MPSKCAYEPCRNASITYSVSRVRQAFTVETNNYCCSSHAILGILESMINEAAKTGNKTIQRSYKTAAAVFTKMMKSVEKEWQKAA